MNDWYLTIKKLSDAVPSSAASVFCKSIFVLKKIRAASGAALFASCRFGKLENSNFNAEAGTPELVSARC